MAIKVLERKHAGGLVRRPPLPADFESLLRNGGAHSNGIETMEDFWVVHGWYVLNAGGELVLTHARWKESPQAKLEAVRTLVQILGKDPREVTMNDFHSNLLKGLLSKSYKDSPYVAVNEAFPELGIKPWEMSTTPQGFSNSKEKRIAARGLLVEKLVKDPREITGEDFHSNRIGAMLVKHYSRSPYRALLEAGLVTPEDESYIHNRRYRL